MDAAVEALVRRFYADAWNRWDDNVVDELLSEDFSFRGSLGTETVGRAGWRAYRDAVRSAVPDFQNEIVDIVTSSDRAAARLLYMGHHHGVLLGVKGDGRPIRYSGAAFFAASQGFLTRAWVLGDLDALRRQITARQT